MANDFLITIKTYNQLIKNESCYFESHFQQPIVT